MKQVRQRRTNTIGSFLYVEIKKQIKNNNNNKNTTKQKQNNPNPYTGPHNPATAHFAAIFLYTLFLLLPGFHPHRVFLLFLYLVKVFQTPQDICTYCSCLHRML